MSAYKVPLVSVSLADRIILAATHVRQRQSIWGWIDRMFEEFKLPLPGYSLTSLLAIGFLVGFLTYDHIDIDIANIGNVYVASGESIDQFLDEDEALL
ncbi:MAG: hypothetical protein E4H07_06000 [Nitrosomonadales bacterium]|nr:MAG: hypothetical protein E4H07_06000 [Nitrosomonadales bacterium]